MLSSISRLLPNNLNINPLDNDLFKSRDSAVIDSPEAEEPQRDERQRSYSEHSNATHEKTKSDATDAAGQPGKRRRKDPASTETFIIVRPPPAKTNHPLNLQVQLVPNVARNERAARRSVDVNGSRETLHDTGETGVPLQRTASTRSNRSETESTYSTTGSISSVSSASTVSGRRIVPLYNLHAHNVMTNTITDAGTDAKVAKFFKRGLEVMGLAILEPIEVWGHYSWDDDHDLNIDNRRFSITVPMNSELPNVIEVPASPIAPTKPAESTSKKLFGRLFKKKDAPSPSPMPQTPIVVEPATPAAPEPHLQPPVLGLQARLHSSTLPPQGRPSTYVWVIRKWIKGSGESWIGGVADSVGGALGMRDGSERNTTEVTEVEVRFEWKKAKMHGTDGSRRRRSMIASTAGQEANEEGKSRRHSSVLERKGTGTSLGSTLSHNAASQAGEPEGGAKGLLRNPSQKNQNRLSLQGFMNRGKTTTSPAPSNLAPPAAAPATGHLQPSRAASPNPPASIATTNTTADEDGEESDPEDSETPWTCTLHLRSRPKPRRPSIISQRSPISTPSHNVDLKLKVATLAPAPHHPKVVAQIKTPFPMPDILIDSGTVRPRTAGLPLENEEQGTLTLTAEEIKDIVSCTGLWVVVREGYGGLAKRRKGDGWLIRG